MDAPISPTRTRDVGVGPALRKARLYRGKSIEEASRETRIRAEYLRALEQERFRELLGDVYVRGFLRSYATYLGLDPDRVLESYRRRFGEAEPALPDPLPGPVRRRSDGLPNLTEAIRHHPSWTFLIGVALLAAGVFASMGLLSRASSLPPAPPPSTNAVISVLPPPVVLGIRGRREVQVTVRIDGGEPIAFLLREGEVRSFEGASRIELHLASGGTADLTVNGSELGRLGERGVPFRATYGPADDRGSPSPAAN